MEKSLREGFAKFVNLLYEATKFCGSSVWNLFHVTVVLRSIPGF
jgi:hypothetical protein